MSKSTNNTVATISVCLVMIVLASSAGLYLKGDYVQAAAPTVAEELKAEQEELQRELGQKRLQLGDKQFARDILLIDLDDAKDEVTDLERDIAKIRRRIETISRKIGGTVDFPQSDSTK